MMARPNIQSKYAERLLRQVPFAQEWQARLVQMRLDDHSKCSAYVHDALRKRRVLYNLEGNVDMQASDLVHLLHDFAAYDASINDSLAIEQAQAKLRKIILLSLCTVLVNRGESYKELDKCLLHVAQNYDQRRATFLGVGRLHCAARSLVDRGWNINRVAELFVLSTADRETSADDPTDDRSQARPHVPLWPP